MKKIDLKIIFYLPFLFSFSFLWKIKIFESASINLLDILLILFITNSFWILIKKNWLLDFWSYWTKKNIFLFLLILFFAFSIFLSSLFNLSNSNWINSLGLIKSTLLLPIAMSIFTSFFVNKKYLFSKKIWDYLLASIFVISIFGFFAIITKNLSFDKRLSIFYDSPNHFAMLISLVIIILIWKILNQKKPSKPLFSSKNFILFLLILNLFFTKSLGSILALSVSLSFLFLLKNNFLKLALLKKLLISVILITTFFLLNISFFVKNSNYQPTIPATSFDSRIAIYQSSEKIIKDNLLFGIGLGNFQKKYLNYQKYFTPYPEWAVPHSHNNLLYFQSQFGIITTILFFIILIFSITKNKKPKSILVFILFCYFVIHGFFDTTLWHNDTSLFFWTILLLL